MRFFRLSRIRWGNQTQKTASGRRRRWPLSEREKTISQSLSQLIPKMFETEVWTYCFIRITIPFRRLLEDRGGWTIKIFLIKRYNYLLNAIYQPSCLFPSILWPLFAFFITAFVRFFVYCRSSIASLTLTEHTDSKRPRKLLVNTCCEMVE